MDKDAKLKIDKAQTGLVMDSPFFATLALNKPWIIDNSIPTGWTDGTQYAYNEAWINSLALPKVIGFNAHEVMHNALLHNLRQGDRDGDTWNEAADYEINPILLDAHFDLPDDYLDSPAFHGKTAEDIYEILKQQKGKGKGKPGAQPGGSPDPGKCGGVKPFPSPGGNPQPTPAEKAHQEQSQKIEVQAALTAAKRAGSLPGSLERLIDELLEPVIPWKEVLARFIDSNAANDYTWTLPNRRYLPQGIYLPSLKSPELGHIGIFDDTSGSHFSAEQQRKALSEIQGILTSYQNVKATLIFVDTKVQGEPIELEADLEINIPKPQGGGGTSFRPPFEYAEEHALEIKAAIYITDGECSNFPEPPDYETLWLLTEANRNFNPPFGEVITMEKEDSENSQNKERSSP